MGLLRGLRAAGLLGILSVFGAAGCGEETCSDGGRTYDNDAVWTCSDGSCADGRRFVTPASSC